MKLPIEWLNEFVNTDGIGIKEYCDRMTDTGSKVEEYEILGADVENVVVGHVLSVERHPDADKLVVCSVDVGEDAPRQIVTAATNVFPGAYVPVAKAPANLPGGIKIKSGKLRGVLSEGMFCSIAELDLTLNDMPDAIEDGILILNEPDMKPGTDIRDLLRLNDTVVEFEITPNRPDCLSVIGLARETAVSFDRPAVWHTPTVKGAGGDVRDYISVEVKNSELCRRYTARAVKNVKIAPSPLWLRMRLRAAGVRPINNVVDITNYVMLEYGQPMHAFDYACLDGKQIVVRNAEADEIFKSLDDKDHTLSPDMLVIADEKKAVALAGVMGGANSEIKDTTTTVIFESACFLGSSVRTTSRALGMRTESSGRFEKGLDAENTMPAVMRACELIEMLGAGEVVDGVIDVYGGKRALPEIPLNAAEINHFLGISVSEEYMTGVLESLDIKVKDGKAVPPSFREDVQCMNDIAEEIARIYGYNKIASTPFSGAMRTGSFTPRQALRNQITDRLLGLGLSEICTYSFISPKYYDKIGLAPDDSRRKCVVISNPLGEETSVMRTTLLPCLMEALSHNISYHNEQAALFENGIVYLPQEGAGRFGTGELPLEPLHTSFGFYGSGDFYTLKGIMTSLLSLMGIENASFTACSDDPTFHPGRCATVKIGDFLCGKLGQIHPTVAAAYGFSAPVYAAEIDTEGMMPYCCYEKEYKPLPKYPAITRDYAFVCDEDTEAGAIEAVMKKAVGKLLESITVFDVYRGSQLPEGKKSIAFGVTMRALDRTLTDADADKAEKKLLHCVEAELGLTLR